MDFLKEVLGEESYNQFVEKINAYNGNEANKDKQIRLGNLASGEYVGKGKFDALQQAMAGKDTEITNANNLIAELKKASKGNEDVQKRVAEYEAANARLQEELAETKIKSAIKVALLSEKAVDVDYLTFKLNEKLKEKGEKLELDENDNIKGWDVLKDGLKVQFPTMFESTSAGDKKIIENKLEKSDGSLGSGGTVTKDAFEKMGYKSRVELKSSNPELYETLTK